MEAGLRGTVAGMCFGTYLICVWQLFSVAGLNQELDMVRNEFVTFVNASKEVKEPVILKKPLYIYPIHKEDFKELSSPYGKRDPARIGGYGDEFHDGVDMWGVSHVHTWHARVVGVADGYVANHWLNHPEYGKMIHIIHDDGNESVYGHLSESFVHERTRDGKPWRVEAGDVIGRQGKTGRTDEEHLHFELWVEGVRVNPLWYIELK